MTEYVIWVYGEAEQTLLISETEIPWVYGEPWKALEETPPAVGMAGLRMLVGVGR